MDPQQIGPRSVVLPDRWRARATELRSLAIESAARAFETAATELEQWLADSADELLSLGEAAIRCGRTRDTVRRAIRDGRIANRGRKHKPLVRTADLVHAFPPRAVASRHGKVYDVAADARSVLARRGA